MKKDKMPPDPEMEKMEDRMISNDIIEALRSTNNVMKQLHKDVWQYMLNERLYKPGKLMKIELGFKNGEFIYKNNKTPLAEKNDWEKNMKKKEENYSKSKETASQNKNDGVSLHVLIMGCDKTADNTYEKAYINNKIMDYLYEELFNYILMARGTKSVKFTLEFKNDKINFINTETTPPKKNKKC